ncbi:DUF4815 domain-containing protein [Pseudoalteromonas rubra]|uniref:DUF4815 domain-containing protein n=1 Tax=Pseudoalteromonas rubra TaxID=43658 RepID=A0A4Q7EPF8_9GAMM|nr:DUF4815 domain-containing protein [Pseudoalteromonas rubra]RZM83796.1 DUF4815 domain-containing protein [Pseudoalteromonas rubra]
MLQDYYHNYDKANGYERLLFRSGRGLQSRELNDLQSQVQNQVKDIADVLLKDGDLVSGGDVVIDTQSGETQLSAAQVYLDGHIRSLPAATLTIALQGSVDIGVWLTHSVVTEVEDPTLRDPAVNALNYDEPGAARLKQHCQWGQRDDALAEENAFYPVHRIEDGVLIIKQPPPQLDAVTQALARYDREANGGSYVVEGMALSYRDREADQQVFSLQEGKAHIQGYEVAFDTARSAAFDWDPDIGTVREEPKAFISVPASGDDTRSMRVDLDFFPVKTVEEVNVSIEKSATLTRAQLAGGEDLLPDESVLEILSVTQGETTFVAGVDFLFLRNHISWQLSGAEPAPGSQFEVRYRFRTQVVVEPDEFGFTLQKQQPQGELVENALITVDYQWYRPRIDLVVLDRFGQLKRIKGQPAHQLPVAPKVPANHLPLAQVSQSWFAEQAPEIENLAVRAVSMSELEQMQSQISDLYQLLAIERLRNDANSEESSSKFGVFVDPFIDDDMRDAGIEQTAAIVDGELILPLSADIVELPLPTGNVLTLPYELEDVLAQTKQTGSMKVNPYQAVEPIPATVRLSPSVDHWTQTSRSWTSPITRRFDIGRGLRRLTRTRTSTQVLRRTTRQAQFMRSRWVNFTISGFGPQETLDRVTFDGIRVQAQEA